MALGLSPRQYPRVNTFIREDFAMGKSTVGERVKAMRKTRGLTQVQLARKVGYSQGALSSLENNDSRWVKSGTLLALALALNVNPHWLERGEGDPARPMDATTDESAAVEIYRRLNDTNRAAWIAAGSAMAAMQDADKATETVLTTAKKPRG